MSSTLASDSLLHHSGQQEVCRCIFASQNVGTPAQPPGMAPAQPLGIPPGIPTCQRWLAAGAECMLVSQQSEQLRPEPGPPRALHGTSN